MEVKKEAIKIPSLDSLRVLIAKQEAAIENLKSAFKKYFKENHKKVIVKEFEDALKGEKATNEDVVNAIKLIESAKEILTTLEAKQAILIVSLEDVNPVISFSGFDEKLAGIEKRIQTEDRTFIPDFNQYTKTATRSEIDPKAMITRLQGISAELNKISFGAFDKLYKDATDSEKIEAEQSELISQKIEQLKKETLSVKEIELNLKSQDLYVDFFNSKWGKKQLKSAISAYQKEQSAMLQDLASIPLDNVLAPQIPDKIAQRNENLKLLIENRKGVVQRLKDDVGNIIAKVKMQTEESKKAFEASMSSGVSSSTKKEPELTRLDPIHRQLTLPQIAQIEGLVQKYISSRQKGISSLITSIFRNPKLTKKKVDGANDLLTIAKTNADVKEMTIIIEKFKKDPEYFLIEKSGKKSDFAVLVSQVEGILKQHYDPAMQKISTQGLQGQMPLAPGS